MTSANIEIARTYFQAVQTADMATLGELLDEGIVWHQPGAHQFSGEHKGRGAVFQMLGGMMEASQGSFAIDTIHTLMANGDLVTATIHFSGRRDNASMSMNGVDLLRIAGGRITEMWLFSEDPATEDAFWG
ncbi:nuclear transport factor 2 family protein [Streptomyces sp. Qhu-G9]|uniref:nuclear transport factor 2 family protein n=1 Tax=Streptomyces sp. Qhu-G9 TaxID=3452799 RepID=UPI0022ABFB01|nr:nuclear transport factor 2 family protein [Streptomyces aurantiacus]WAU82000.1 nuclear transport factor 2 family protein [Streptomyces aurantiacus]